MSWTRAGEIHNIKYLAQLPESLKAMIALAGHTGDHMDFAALHQACSELSAEDAAAAKATMHGRITESMVLGMLQARCGFLQYFLKLQQCVILYLQGDGAAYRLARLLSSTVLMPQFCQLSTEQSHHKAVLLDYQQQ